MTVTALGLVAILPCNDLDASEAFYAKLGFTRPDSDRGRAAPGEPDTYRILSHPDGGRLHLTEAVEDWLVRDRNPFGLYFYAKDIDGLAAAFAGSSLGSGRPEDKAWGMYEFALSDPDETLVRIGRPSRNT